ncbi:MULTISPECIES: hypothetical protein [Streptomyces]|uniref:Uncharacterized protein n=2 Tax=Streptomyces TaxID=1883 RepID=A0A117IUC2_9ACTN|nr:MULTISPECIES: hypothetical protein [Streptomyces]KUH35690.1 hypothetical protein ATE80_27695 [Streptomyces kanasensis]UUS31445.1 hypothetical protein NRO40_11775 [Streptomyces changanensis]
MQTTITPFTLAAWKAERTPGVRRRQFGWLGTSPDFGDIRVIWPALPHIDSHIATEVHGGSIPAALYEVRGLHVELMDMPTLNRAELRVGDGRVQMRRNRWASTRRGRSLRMTYLGDGYRLTAIDRRSYTLTREAGAEDPGSTIKVRQAGTGKNKRITVEASGRVLPADVSLAVLFAGVDRAVLTKRGAVRATFSRLFGFWAETYS